MTFILLAVSFISQDGGRAGIFLDVCFGGKKNHAREWIFSFRAVQSVFLSVIALQGVTKSNIQGNWGLSARANALKKCGSSRPMKLSRTSTITRHQLSYSRIPLHVCGT